MGLTMSTLSLSPTPPLADHLVRYFFFVADWCVAAGSAPGAAFATTAAVPGVAWAVAWIAIDVWGG